MVYKRIRGTVKGTISGEATFHLFCVPSEKGFTLKGQFAPKSKFLPFGVDSFSEGV